MKVLKKIQTKVPSNLPALPQVLHQFNQICPDFLPHETWLPCQLALAQGFTNTVRHGNCHLPEDTPIEIEIIQAQAAIEVRIWDRGAGFDLDPWIIDNFKENWDYLEGERGIAILTKIVYHLEYYPTGDGHNCLLIVKQLFEQSTSNL